MKRKGCHREMWPEGSAEQGRASRWTGTGSEAYGAGRLIAKPTSIKDTGGKSRGCLWKAIELTSRDLRHVVRWGRHNPLNRRMRPRMSGWCGRERGRPFPLCRLESELRLQMASAIANPLSGIDIYAKQRSHGRTDSRSL